MAPLTRSHTRYMHGDFCKYVMEQPTIMNIITNNLETNAPIKIAIFSLKNLKLVFKSDRCVDVLKSAVMKSEAIGERVDDFMATVHMKLQRIELIENTSSKCENVLEMFEYIVQFNDVLRRQEFKAFVRMAIYKIDSLASDKKANHLMVKKLQDYKRFFENI